MESRDIASLFAANAYPGRGIALGLCPDGKTAALTYFIMGRSANSRNRAFVRNGADLGIRVLDEQKLSDPSLILYAPVRTLPGATVVTNGDQTDTVREALLSGGTFEQALRTRRFEPDAPHYTPRISGLMRFAGGFSYALSIIKCADGAGKAALHQFFEYEPVPGLGHLIHTYRADGTPLPSFAGEPVPVRVPDDIAAFTDALWNALNEEHKVALYARYTDTASGAYADRLFNKYASEE